VTVITNLELPMRIRNHSSALTALLALGTIAASAAFAQDMVLYATPGYLEGLRTKEMMHMIDTDKDGTVSKDEWIAYQERVFVALDKNKDGFLETDEFYGPVSTNVIPFATLGYAHGLMTKEMFGKIDANGDGKVSKDEYLAFQMKIFDMMDAHKKQQLGVADFIVQKPSY
jgi:EF hand domain-containing protein